MLYWRRKNLYLNLFSVGFGRIFLSKFKYRDRATIVAEILDTMYRDPKGKTKTGIMRATNLNFAQANRYLELLLLRGFITEIDPIRSQELARYKPTKKGLQLVNILETSRFSLR